MQQLLGLGWSSWFETHFAALGASHLVPGRVIQDSRETYVVLTAGGEVLARPAGALRHRSSGSEDLPVAGDWVALRLSEDGSAAVVQAVLPRKARLARKVPGTVPRADILAANVDVAFLVTPIEADLNVRRLERSLVMVYEGGVTPVVLLTKTDVAADVGEAVRLAEEAAPAVPVHAVSARVGTGLEALAPYLTRGRTLALLGASGSGKSTLVNRLLGREVQVTAPVREGDGRGRHATTSRHLFALPGGALLLDTPGLREVALWGDGGASPFAEIEALAAACRFRDCRHEAEPGCAVRAALHSGEIDPERLSSFHKLARELAWAEERRLFGANGADRRRWKRIMGTAK